MARAPEPPEVSCRFLHVCSWVCIVLRRGMPSGFPRGLRPPPKGSEPRGCVWESVRCSSRRGGYVGVPGVADAEPVANYAHVD